MVGHVYFVEAIGLGRVKIGWSADMTMRLSQLQVGCPADLRLLVAAPCEPELERIVQGKFRALHVRGEWFDLDPELLAFIAALVEVPDVMSLITAEDLRVEWVKRGPKIGKGAALANWA